MTLSPLVPRALALALCCSTADASTPQEPPPFDLRPFGLQEEPDHHLAMGSGFKAYLRESSVEFHPALGRSAEVNQPLVLEFESVSRGGEETYRVAAAPTRRAEALSVVYEHSGGPLERYDVFPEGIEQSFVFGEKPEGQGDLVVSLRWSSPLTPPLEAGRVGELEFRHAGQPAVRLDRVVGIDADGSTASGWMSRVGDRIELGLPSEFVESARYPLVLDPFVTPIYTIDLGLDVFDPVVAFDPVSQLFAVAFGVTFSSADSDVYIQRSTDESGPFGFTFALESSATREATHPTIAGGSDGWIVAWREATNSAGSGSDIVARGYTSDGGTGPPLVFGAGTSLTLRDPDIAGPLPDLDEFFLVWNENFEAIEGSLLRLDEQGNVSLTFLPFMGSIFDLSDSLVGDSVSDPDIATGGPNGNRWLVAWEEFFGGFPGESDIRGRFLQPLSIFASSPFGIVSVPFTDERAPSVAGDGTHWAVAYEHRESLFDTDVDVHVRAMRFDGSALSFGNLKYVEADADDVEFEPQIAWSGSDYVLALRDATPSGFVVNVRGLDPLTLESTGLIDGMPTFHDDTGSPSVAMPPPGSEKHGRAVVVAATQSATFNETVKVITYESPGTVEDLEGGCGEGGEALAAGAYGFNQSFSIGLRNAEPFSSTFLIASPNPFEVSCGSCTLVPDLASSIVLAGPTTSQFGESVLPITLFDSLSDLRLYLQWAVLTIDPSCAALSVDLSNALEVTFL